MILFMYFLSFCLVNINCNEYYTTKVNNEIKKVDEMDSLYMKSIIDVVRGSSVDIWVSPDNVVYCKLISPRGLVFYDYFGRCRLSIDRVTLEHDGHWEKYVGYPGTATLKVEKLYINVIEREPKTKVHTAVEESSPNIMKLTCMIPSRYQVQGCKFRGPQNMTLLAFGTAEDIVEVNETGFESRFDGTVCSLQITNPRVTDLGFWRCAMYTEQDTYYGFVTVLSSWFINATSVVEAIRRGPLLKADHGDIRINDGEPVTMSCSIDAPIRYCYFWMSDGTIYNVSPGLKSSSMEYVGSGFDAGECGLKLQDLNYSNFGRRWSCNVALAAGTQQNRDFWVFIRDRMQVSQQDFGSLSIILSGLIDNSQLEYCRYVQDGGFGFSYDNTPPRYEFIGSLSKGSCELRIHNPDTWSDYSPWTIIAKVKGEDEEISRRTRGLPLPSYQQYANSSSGWEIFGWVLLGVVIAGFLLVVSVGPQRNRNWISRRATVVRQSFRRQPPPPYTPTS